MKGGDKVKSTPLVSIIIPTYGRANYLKSAIDSVLSQSYQNIEILVIDDNNPDTLDRKETEIILKSYASNSKVKFIQHHRNMNGSAARNTGIRHANGEFICFLDDDDLFLEKKIEKQVKCLLELDDSWGCCYTNYIKKIGNKLFEKNGEFRNGNLLDIALMRDLFIQAGSNLLIRSSVVKEIGYFDESFKRNQDLEYLVRILKKYKIAYVDEIGLIVNLRKNRTSINYEETTNEFINKFKYEIDSSNKKREIYNMLYLQVFRYYVSNKEIAKAIKYQHQHSISPTLIIKYFLYLIKRKKEKKCYGFTTKQYS